MKTRLTEHFTIEELDPKCYVNKLSEHDRYIMIRKLTLVAKELEKIREKLGCPIIVNSCLRSPKHNIAVGGKPNSHHLFDLMGAVDITGKFINGKTNNFTELLVGTKFRRIAYYPNDRFIHLDFKGNGVGKKINGSEFIEGFISNKGKWVLTFLRRIS